MTDFDALADWLGEQPYARNRRDFTDEETTVLDVDVDTLARDILASAWMEERDQGQREQGWNDALNAIAWCVDNQPGDYPPDYADAIEYVAKNNAHAKQEPSHSSTGAES